MKFLPIAFLLASSISYAQIWDYVITSEAGTIYFIDPISIVKNDDVVTYSQLLNYPNGYDSKNRKIHSIQHTKQINCKDNTSRTISMIAYEKENLKGDVLTLSVGRETAWSQINKNSILSLYREEVCK